MAPRGEVTTGYLWLTSGRVWGNGKKRNVLFKQENVRGLGQRGPVFLGSCCPHRRELLQRSEPLLPGDRGLLEGLVPLDEALNFIDRAAQLGTSHQWFLTT